LEGAYAIGLDVGGTSLKAALISSKGRVLKGSFNKILIDSQGSREHIIRTFTKIVSMMLDTVKEKKLNLAGLSISTCGPFDLDNGVFLMKHKYASVYGISLKEVLRKHSNLPEKIPIVFDYDSWSFVRGEAWVGAARNYNRIVGLTLGGGLGSAFMVDGKIVTEGKGVPPLGSFWDLPYKGGIFEEMAPVCKRSIIRRYRELGGEYREGMDVKDIALRALEKRDRQALQVFKELGTELGQVLKPFMLEFRPDCIIFGGGISKSSTLFIRSFRAQLRDVKSLKKVSRAKNIDLAGIYGVARLLFEKLKVY